AAGLCGGCRVQVVKRPRRAGEAAPHQHASRVRPASLLSRFVLWSLPCEGGQSWLGLRTSLEQPRFGSLIDGDPRDVGGAACFIRRISNPRADTRLPTVLMKFAVQAKKG